MHKLPFEVVVASSEDAAYKAKELNIHKDDTVGWQANKFCEYPQEIGLLINSGRPVHLKKVQILCHESKIPTSIDIYTGIGISYHTCQFKKLGFIEFDANEATNYEARELQSVQLNEECQFVKFMIHQCYVNKYNLFNQVGIIAVNFNGTQMDQVVVQALSSPSRFKIAPPIDNSFMMDLEVKVEIHGRPRTKNMLELVEMLQVLKENAAESNDFDLATDLKNLGSVVYDMALELRRLEYEKYRMVQQENYPAAKLIKIDIDRVYEKLYEAVEGLYPEARMDPDSQQNSTVNQKMDAEYSSKVTVEKTLAKSTSVDCLQGVPNYEQLPVAEPLNPTSAQSMMIAAFGEYIVRCLFSKHWNLREAALMKIRENVLYGANASHIAFDMYFKIVSIGLKDSKAQVFQACCKLFGSLLKNKWNISNDELRQQVKRIIPLICWRFGDNQPRLRDSASTALVTISTASCGGQNFTIEKVIKAAGEDPHIKALKNLQGYIKTMQAIIGAQQDCPKIENTAMLAMEFMSSQDAFSHANNDIRSTAKEFCKILYIFVGKDIEIHLQTLRTVQVAEYRQEFRKIDEGQSIRNS